MITEHIQRFCRSFQQIRTVTGLHNQLLNAASFAICTSFTKSNVIPAGSTRPYTDAIRIGSPQPFKKQILVTAVMCRRIAFRKSCFFHHIWFVGKFCGIYRHSVFFTVRKEFFRFSRMPWFFCAMQSRTVGHRYDQFCPDGFYKIQYAGPLFFCQYIQITFRNLAIRRSVKIIIRLRCPGSGHTYPDWSQLFRQAAQLFIIQINWRIHLHQILIHGLNSF